MKKSTLRKIKTSKKSTYKKIQTYKNQDTLHLWLGFCSRVFCSAFSPSAWQTKPTRKLMHE